jgi:hypothetical protein
MSGYDKDAEDSDIDVENGTEPLEEQGPSEYSLTIPKQATHVSSVCAYAALPVDEQQQREQGSYDPDEEYVRNYDNLGRHFDQRRVKEKRYVTEETVADIEETLLSCTSGESLTPREITDCLSKYNSGISSTYDLEKKRVFIKRYEMHKFKFDEDNEEDKEKADSYLTNARNVTMKPSDRLEYYQTAIKFTNNYTEKQKLRDEYRQYAYTLYKSD